MPKRSPDLRQSSIFSSARTPILLAISLQHSGCQLVQLAVCAPITMGTR